MIEIEVRGYKRKIRRRRYRPACQCEHLPGIITAPGPAKLIPKGRLGVSLWVEILLDKYAFIRPTQRLLSDLRSHDIDLSLGTVTGGLKQLAPVFKPIREEIIRMNLDQLV
ncbi:MAG: IS66 family transposase, partial [bacterium]|nr:IS66 family transposase [bacterium]